MSEVVWFLVGWCIGTAIGLAGVYLCARLAARRWLS